MVDWKKYEVPDWVVDDYNSRVSEKDRMPLGSYSDMETEDDWIPSNDNNKLQTSKSKNEADTPINEDDIEGLIGLVITLSIVFGLIVLVTACK